MLIMLERLLLLCTGLLVFCTVYANEPAAPEADEMANVKQLWQVIDSSVANIESTVAEQQLSRIHYYTNTLRVAIKSLPSYSNMLSESQLAQIKSNVKLAEEIVDRIDGASHAENATIIEENLASLQPVLAEMRANYPDTVSNRV